MKVNRIILALKVSFLLIVFGATTLYFQYAALKKSYFISCEKDQASEKSSDNTPLTEEETETEQSSNEEESQDDDRALHDLDILLTLNRGSSITLSTFHSLDFKEVHFEIVTPPPQA